jgi:hypothetical protein
MKRFTIEGVKCIYLFREDKLESEMNIEGIAVSSILQDKALFIANKIRTGSAIRYVLVESRKAFGVSVWEPHILLLRIEEDITTIDSKILNNIYSDDDFADAILAKYQKTFCTNCDWVGDTLVVHIDTMNPQLMKILNTKIQGWKFKMCPQCGHSLRQPVIKIF